MATRKTFTFAVMHMTVAFAVVYLMTGSLAIGGAVAMIEPAVNTIAYFFHEKVWERFGLGRAHPEPEAAAPLNPRARCLQCQWRTQLQPSASSARAPGRRAANA
jgi:uncharacterized membrane protein